MLIIFPDSVFKNQTTLLFLAQSERITIVTFIDTINLKITSISEISCQSPHHKGRWSRSRGAPRQSEGDRGRQESRRMNGG